jgi:exopolysaccharide/PEP-CTERM locus tyrosine autokinase
MDLLVAQLTTLAKGLCRFRWPALAVVWVVAVAVVVLVFRVPDKHEATAWIFVDTQSILKPLIARLAVQPNVEQQVAMLGPTLISRANMEKLVRMADLDLKSESKAEQEALVTSLMTTVQIKNAGRDSLYSLPYRDSSPAEAPKETPNAPRSRIVDEFRVIKRPLIGNAVGRGAQALAHGNLIMVTSAMPGEGKSFTALSLAMNIAADLDHTVMLVAADVARPSILRVAGLLDGPGFLDLLEGKAEMANVMLKTSLDKRTIPPSGIPHARAAELLASNSVRLLRDDISKRYPDRIVIFDSPPLILTTEARVLATQMGQVVLFVQAEKSLQADVQHALTTIESCPVKMMLLNRVRTDAKGSCAYGNGYGSDKKAA